MGQWKPTVPKPVASNQDVATCSKHTASIRSLIKKKRCEIEVPIRGHFFLILARVYPYVTCVCILWSFWYRILCSAYSASTPKNFPVTSLIIITSHTINKDKFLLEHCARVQSSNPANRGERFKACIVQGDKTCKKTCKKDLSFIGGTKGWHGIRQHVDRK